VQVVRVYYFTSEARRMFEAAIRQGEAAGVDGYIIDMRNNPGEQKMSLCFSRHAAGARTAVCARAYMGPSSSSLYIRVPRCMCPPSHVPAVGPPAQVGCSRSR
jgi:hypothetical protein